MIDMGTNFILAKDLSGQEISSDLKNLLPGIYVSQESVGDSTYKAFDVLFPEGLRVDEEGLRLYESLVGARPSETMNPKSFAMTLERLGFRWIQRGTYASPLRIPSIPESLLEEIKHRITSLPIIAYSALLSEYSSRLEALGIANRYILKSVLDPFMPEGYRASRDYIKKEGVDSAQVGYRKLLSESSYIFIPDILKRFPGTTRHAVQIEIYKRKDLIRKDKDTYCTLEEMDIPPSNTSNPGLETKSVKTSDLIRDFHPKDKKEFNLKEFNDYLSICRRKRVPLYEASTLLRSKYILVRDTTFIPFNQERWTKEVRYLTINIERNGPLHSKDVETRLAPLMLTAPQVLGLAVNFKESFRVRVLKDRTTEVQYIVDARKKV